jgi:putative transposase
MPPVPIRTYPTQLPSNLVARTRTLVSSVATLPGVLSSWRRSGQTDQMKTNASTYHGYRFPPDIISHAVWLYHRFCLSFRDVEDLLAQRGITVSYETVRQWCRKFGIEYARTLRRRQGRLGDTWHLDELFVTIQGQRQYLWRAVDQDGDVIDILVQPPRDQHAAERFFRKLLKGQQREPRRLVTDKLRTYEAARRTVMPSVLHDTERYANNRAEVPHEPIRQRERQCEGSNPLLKRNDSGLCTESFRIFSELDATCCGQSTTGLYELVRSWFGMK